MKHKNFVLALGGALVPGVVFAATPDLEQHIANNSMMVATWASVIVLALICLTALTKNRSNAVFGLIMLTVLGSSTYLIGSTVYLNQVSSSQGPVHWHADTEIWDCGTELDIKDPVGKFSNKIGTPTLHEHNDKRIHLEGVVVNKSDASLGKFFRVIGGEISSNSMVLPTNSGKKTYLNGQACKGEAAELQAFVYKTTSDKHYTLEKITDPANYLISPYSTVPPADCVIIEFDVPKATTDRMCRSYQVALEIGRLKGEGE